MCVTKTKSFIYFITKSGIVKRDTGPASNLQKIEPKLPIQAAKIVYIKNPNGTQQSIRIGGSLIGGNQAASANNLNSNPNASSGTGIQKLQLLQLKNKNVNVAAGSAAAASNSPRFVLKSGPAPQKFILSSGGSGGGTATAAGATAVKIGAAAGPSGTATRTLTVSQAQQMGLIVSTNKTNASASSPTTTKTLILPTGGTAAGIALKNPPTILNKSVKSIQPSKIVIHSDTTVSGGADADAKPKTAAPSIVKVAGTGQQVRVLTGQGKGGLQYVRVLNAIPTANANSATANKIVNGRQQQVSSILNTQCSLSIFIVLNCWFLGVCAMCQQRNATANCKWCGGRWYIDWWWKNSICNKKTGSDADRCNNKNH